MSRGTCTSAREEERMEQAQCSPAEGTGPIMALQLKALPGNMKLWPCTVTASPAKGDRGEALTETGTSEA